MLERFIHKQSNVFPLDFDEYTSLLMNPGVARAVHAGEIESGRVHYGRVGQKEKRPFRVSPDFNEQFYLMSNPDVRWAVERGEYTSGTQHFYLYGHKETFRTWAPPPEPVGMFAALRSGRLSILALWIWGELNKRVQFVVTLLKHRILLRFFLSNKYVHDLKWINIEFSSKCNLRCKWCSLDHAKPATYISPEILARVIDEITDNTKFRIETIDLHNAGETLFHPNFQELVTLLEKKKRRKDSQG